MSVEVRLLSSELALQLEFGEPLLWLTTLTLVFEGRLVVDC